MTTAELIVLALALDTVPLALLYPAPYLDKIQAFPGNLEVTKIWAAQWFSGLASGVDADGAGNLVQLELLSAMRADSNLKALQRARSAQKLDEVQLERIAELNRKRQTGAASSEETARLVSEIADLQKDIDELWSLGGRDLAAERFEQLTKGRGADSDGG
ncbi:hypothetical protein AWC11_22005 [Mycobacterium interjectum]|nr:hypothetical protein AWC11_22005 [Mycobacterium interjectum]